MTDIKENRCFYYTLYFNLKEEPLIIVLAYTIKKNLAIIGLFFYITGSGTCSTVSI